jgi:uncharacterized protein DUF2798
MVKNLELNTRFRSHLRAGGNMNQKSRLVMALVMSCAMSGMVTMLATFINLGLPHDFLLRWLEAWSFAWPIAGVTAYVVMPLAQRATDRLVPTPNGQQ